MEPATISQTFVPEIANPMSADPMRYRPHPVSFVKLMAGAATVPLPTFNPRAKGIRAVVVDWPSLVTQSVRPVSSSVCQVFWTVEEIVVPVTTGMPAVVLLNTHYFTNAFASFARVVLTCSGSAFSGVAA